MKWYDVFSNFYDQSLEKLYFESRERAVELLQLKPGQNILDVACGTGANFIHIKNTGIENLNLYGTDNSEGMLRKAQSTVVKQNISNVLLFQADAGHLTPSLVLGKTNKVDSFDRVLCVLALSVIDEWEKVMENLLQLTNDNGRVVIMDVFAEKRTFNTWLVEKIASADTSRQIWQSFQNKTDNFYQEYLPLKESTVGGKLFVATGVKKSPLIQV